MTPDQAADELYALPVAELDSFAGRRGELVKQARAAGDKDLAAAIGKFRKPVLAAALANQLVRDEPGALAELTELAGQLRDAHRHLRGEELRRLSERRQRLLGQLVRLGSASAGRSVTEAVQNQLRATFEAAIADPQAEQAVRSGRLTAPLSYSGFGEVDLSDAVALPPPLRAVPDQPAAKPVEHGAGSASQAEQRARARAERVRDEAADQLDEAIEGLDAARAAEAELAEQITQLQDQLEQARAAAARAAKATAAAEREHGRRVRALERAEEAIRG